MRDPFPVYYSMKDIAARLSVSYRTVQRWLADGRLGPRERILEVGGHLRVPWSAVEAFLRSSAVVRVGEAPAVHQDAGGRFSAIPERDLAAGTPARTAGELRRKLNHANTR